MSIVFINPLWLWGILPVVLIGLAALGYGYHRKIIFPALDFFPPQVKPGLAGRTGIDWLWLLVFIGALLAALAPAGMQVQFKSPSAPPPVRLFAVGRALPGTATADLWIKSRSPLAAPHYRLTVQAGGKTLVFTLSGWRLMHGCTCSGIPAAPSMQLTLATGGQVFARKTLLRQPAPTPFNIDLIGQISPALVRLVRLMPGVHWNQPRTLPTITLIERTGDATSFAPVAGTLRVPSGISPLVGAPPPYAAATAHGVCLLQRRSHGTGTVPATKLTASKASGRQSRKSFAGYSTNFALYSVIIALGRTPAPNMTVGRIVKTTAGSTPAIDQPTNPLFRHVSLATVHVKQLFVARLGPSWRILASIGGQPWLAERLSPRTHIHWFWLASPPRDRFTDWQHHVSFVIFFANLVRQTVGPSGGPGGSNGYSSDTWWRAARPSHGLQQISPAGTASSVSVSRGDVPSSAPVPVAGILRVPSPNLPSSHGTRSVPATKPTASKASGRSSQMSFAGNGTSTASYSLSPLLGILSALLLTFAAVRLVRR